MAGYPTYHVNVIKLKWEIICTDGLPNLSRLPHLPGVSHLHVNRPLDTSGNIFLDKNCKWKVNVGAVFRVKMPARKGTIIVPLRAGILFFYLLPRPQRILTIATNLENYQGDAFLCPDHLNLVDKAPIFTNHALYKPPTTRKVCFFYTQTTVKMYRNRSYILSFDQ